MPELDALIYKMAFVAVLVALVRRCDSSPALLLCASFIITDMIFVVKPSWEELELYFFQHAAKDFLIAVALFLMYKPSAFFLAMTFIVSSLFHKFAQIEVANNILDLKHIRTDFMTWLTVLQIATIYTALINCKGGQNGGKRVRRTFFDSRTFSRRFFHSKAFKVMP